MNQESNFFLALIASAVLEQNAMHKQEIAMLKELLNQSEDSGHRLWLMHRGQFASTTRQNGARARTAKKHRMSGKQSGK